MCDLMCATCVQVPTKAREGINSLELEFQVVVSHPVWVLGNSNSFLLPPHSIFRAE